MNIKVRVILIAVLAVIAIYSCKKGKKSEQDSAQKNLPNVQTIGINSIGETSAVCEANVTDAGSSQIIDVGLCWNTNPEPDLSKAKISVAPNLGVFQATFSPLNPNTTYFVRAYATNGNGTSFGEEKTFTTKESPPPYLGKYVNGTGAFLEFFAGGEIHFGASGYVTGTYTMLSATRVKINLGNIGEAEFSNAFTKLTTSVGVFNK